MKVKLSEIVDAMDMQPDESYHYLNLETGEITYLTDEEISYAEDDTPLEEIPEWQRPVVEVAKEILDNSEKYIQFPGKFEIHEYRIMEDFCLSIDKEAVRNEMYFSIKGRGAFRMFKHNLRRFNLEKAWYRFREAEFYRIAREWCEYNEVEYIDDREKDQ